MKTKNNKKSLKFLIAFNLIAFSLFTSAAAINIFYFFNNLYGQFLLFILIVIVVVSAVVVANNLTKSLKCLVQKLKCSPESLIDTEIMVPSSIKEIKEIENYTNKMLSVIKDKKFIEDSFSKNTVVLLAEKHIRDFKKVHSDGKRKKVLIVGSELLGINEMSRIFSPEIVLQALWDYISKIMKIVQVYKGYIYRMDGESIISIFGAKEEDVLYENKGIYAARKILEEINLLNQEQQEKMKGKVEIGLFVLSGEIILNTTGKIIADNPMDFIVSEESIDALGKMRSLLKRKDLIICETTYYSIKDKVEVVSCDSIRVRGRKEPVKLFKLVNFLVSEDDVFERRKFKRIQTDIPMKYKPSGSTIEFQNAMLNLSGGGLLMKTSQWLGKDLLIDIEFTLQDIGHLEGIKGKVVECKEIDISSLNPQFEARVEFIDISEELRDKIKKFVYEEERS